MTSKASVSMMARERREARRIIRYARRLQKGGMSEHEVARAAIRIEEASRLLNELFSVGTSDRGSQLARHGVATGLHIALAKAIEYLIALFRGFKGNDPPLI